MSTTAILMLQYSNYYVNFKKNQNKSNVPKLMQVSPSPPNFTVFGQSISHSSCTQFHNNCSPNLLCFQLHTSCVSNAMLCNLSPFPPPPPQTSISISPGPLPATLVDNWLHLISLISFLPSLQVCYLCVKIYLFPSFSSKFEVDPAV